MRPKYPCHLVRPCPCPWDKAIEPEDQSHLISNLFACNMCRSAFPLALAAAALSRGHRFRMCRPSPSSTWGESGREGEVSEDKTKGENGHICDTHATPRSELLFAPIIRCFLFFSPFPFFFKVGKRATAGHVWGTRIGTVLRARTHARTHHPSVFVGVDLSRPLVWRISRGRRLVQC